MYLDLQLVVVIAPNSHAQKGEKWEKVKGECGGI